MRRRDFVSMLVAAALCPIPKLTDKEKFCTEKGFLADIVRELQYQKYIDQYGNRKMWSSGPWHPNEV